MVRNFTTFLKFSINDIISRDENGPKEKQLNYPKHYVHSTLNTLAEYGGGEFNYSKI